MNNLSKKAYLNYADYFVPDTTLLIADFVRDLKDEAVPKLYKTKREYLNFLKNDCGLTRISVDTNLDVKKSLELLILKMLKKLLLKKEEIDLIINISELNIEKNLGQFIQYKLNFNNANILNVTGNHCSNSDVAINLAKKLIISEEKINNVLVIGYSKCDNNSERVVGNYGVLGDGAGIGLVSSKDIGIGLEVVDNVTKTNGLMYDEDLVSDYSLLHFKYYLDVIKELVDKRKLNIKDVNCFVTQNANIVLIRQTLISIGAEEKHIYDKNINKYGHMDSIDFIINMSYILKLKKFSDLTYIMSIGIGVAGSYITTLFKS